MKMVHSPLMGGLLYLVQEGEVWAGCGSTQSPHRCIKCNSSPIVPSVPITVLLYRLMVRCSAVLMCPICRHATFHPNPCTRFSVGLILLTDRQTYRQTDKRTRANAFTSSFVGGKLWTSLFTTSCSKKMLISEKSVCVTYYFYEQFVLLGTSHHVSLISCVTDKVLWRHKSISRAR